MYWDLHLIWAVTFTKIVIFYVRNGLKFDFGSTSTMNHNGRVSGLQSSLWWLMMMTGHFVKNSFLIEFWSKIKSTGNFYVLGCNFNKVWWSWMCAFCVQSSSSVFSTNSVRYHTKHWYGLFRKVLPKDFTSDRPQDRIGELTSNQVLSSENLKTRTL